MLVFQVLLHRLSFHEKADAHKRCSVAGAQLVESHPVSQVTMSGANNPHDDDDKFQIALALQDGINAQQIGMVLQDLGRALGIDLHLGHQNARSAQNEKRVTSRLIDI